MSAHADHTDHESTSQKVTPARSPAVQRAPSGGASTSSSGIARPGLEETIARARSTRGPMTAEPQGRVQRSALISPAASVGRDPSGAIRRVDIEQANAEREMTRVLLEVEVHSMAMHFDALISVLPELRSLSVLAITQPAVLGAFFGRLPAAIVQIDQLARDLDRVKKLLDARRREIISPAGKMHLEMVDEQLGLLTNDLYVWRGLVMAPPQGGMPFLLDVLNRASYYKGTILGFISPLLLKNEDEIKGIPTAPPPPPPMTEQEIQDGVNEQEMKQEMRGQEIMNGMGQRGIMEPPRDPDRRAVAQKETVLQELKQRNN